MKQIKNIAFLLYPNMTQLDLTGPAQVFARLPDVNIHYAWKNIEPIPTDCGLTFLPSITLEELPEIDMLCVPGGAGCFDLMQDPGVISWLRSFADKDVLITSVCIGSLVLGAAGLLQGYHATTHWVMHEALALFGAIPVQERVVIDRNRITGGGVTAGIDFALALIEQCYGKEQAEKIQLILEYDPNPPVHSGSPDAASKQVLAAVRQAFEDNPSYRASWETMRQLAGKLV